MQYEGRGSQMKKKIIINTDIGDDADDAVAIALALNSDEIEIKGITTVFKNTKLRAKMAKDLLEIYDRNEIPVFPGYGMPLIERLDINEPPIQIENLLKDHKVDEEVNAVDFIINTIKEDPETIIVEMGPQTNLALAFLKAPDIMKQAKIISMGGAFLSTFPEWNIVCDPEAARIVTDFAQDLTMIGLDVTKYCKVSGDQLNKFEESNVPQIQYLYKGMEVFMRETGYPITLHDALLIVYLIKEDLFTLKQGDFGVELSGTHARGSIVHKSNYYEIKPKLDKKFYYVVDLDLAKVMDLILNRIFSKNYSLER